MAIKIGEALVSKGTLTRQQLDAALNAQLMRGGHLGTNLVELGFIDEATLGSTLAELLGVRCAPKEMFDAIPPDVIAAVPREEAIQRRVVPIGLDGRSLFLAVIDTKRLSNLSIITGYKVVVHVAPEARILEALERYYGAPRRMRFLNRPAPLARVSLPVSSVAPAGPRATPGPEPRPCAPEATPPRKPKRELAPVMSAEMRELGHRMSRVLTHAELGDVLLDHALAGCQRRVLFAVEGGQAAVANAKNLDVDSSMWSGVRIPIEPDSIFGLASEDSFYRGPVPTEVNCAPFFGKLAIDAPQEMVLLPIYGEATLEAVLYGDGGANGSIEQPPDAYPQMQEMIGLAVRMLTLRAQLSGG